MGTSWAILHRRRGSPGASLLPFSFPRGYDVGDRPHRLGGHHTAQSALEAPTLSLHRTTPCFWGCCSFASWIMSGLGPWCLPGEPVPAVHHPLEWCPSRRPLAWWKSCSPYSQPKKRRFHTASEDLSRWYFNFVSIDKWWSLQVWSSELRKKQCGSSQRKDQHSTTSQSPCWVSFPAGQQVLLWLHLQKLTLKEALFVTTHTSCRKCHAFVNDHRHLLPSKAGKMVIFQGSAFLGC